MVWIISWCSRPRNSQVRPSSFPAVISHQNHGGFNLTFRYAPVFLKQPILLLRSNEFKAVFFRSTPDRWPVHVKADRPDRISPRSVVKNSIVGAIVTFDENVRDPVTSLSGSLPKLRHFFHRRTKIPALSLQKTAGHPRA